MEWLFFSIVNLFLSKTILTIEIYKLVVVGLTENKKEQTITLNPSGDSTKTIQAVQKLLVSKMVCSFLFSVKPTTTNL
jgi:hypothetical protein